MEKLFFATTNPEKVQIARTVCLNENITVVPVSLDIDEIQGEDSEIIIRDKAHRAYQQLGKPVVVSDDSWDIKALKGFPGAYMKSINHWFAPEDFLRLMYGKKDRRITIHQYLAYTDGNITETFKNNINGQIIDEVRGISKKSPNMTIVVLDSDNGKTLAEVYTEGASAIKERYKNRPDAWHKFLKWYKINNHNFSDY